VTVTVQHADNKDFKDFSCDLLEYSKPRDVADCLRGMLDTLPMEGSLVDRFPNNYRPTPSIAIDLSGDLMMGTKSGLGRRGQPYGGTSQYKLTFKTDDGQYELVIPELIRSEKHLDRMRDDLRSAIFWVGKQNDVLIVSVNPL
jgi:hypothetical protein